MHSKYVNQKLETSENLSLKMGGISKISVVQGIWVSHVLHNCLSRCGMLSGGDRGLASLT